ncbi:hypothetical protein ACRCUN_18435 [Mycobacterium sp. LTG2003]
MRRVWMAAATLAAATALAACSSSDPEPAPTSEAPAEHGSYAHCLSEHGVPAPPGPAASAPPGVDPSIWQQAMQACSTLAPGPS